MLDAHVLTAECCWNLFCNASVNGGYLGKSLITQLMGRYPNVSLLPFSKSGLNFQAQHAAFLAHCAQAPHLTEVQDIIVNKVQLLPSLQKTMRCINVPVRLVQAAAAASAAASAAAQEPAKATMDDNLYARGVLFLKFSETDSLLRALFTRYFGNEQSKDRHAMDTDGFRSSDILNQICVVFNTSTDFDDFVDENDVHLTVCYSIALHNSLVF